MQFVLGQVRRKAQDLRLHDAQHSLSAAAQAVTGAVASKWSALMRAPSQNEMAPRASLPMQEEVPYESSPMASLGVESQGDPSNMTRAESLDLPPRANAGQLRLTEPTRMLCMHEAATCSFRPGLVSACCRNTCRSNADNAAGPVALCSQCRCVLCVPSWIVCCSGNAGPARVRRKQMEQLQEAMEQASEMQLSDVQEETVGSLQKRLAGVHPPWQMQPCLACLEASRCCTAERRFIICCADVMRIEWNCNGSQQFMP